MKKPKAGNFLSDAAKLKQIPAQKIRPQGAPRSGTIKRTGVRALLEHCFSQFARRWREDFVIKESDYAMLLRVALDPEILASEGAAGLKLHFLKFYAAHPDFTLAATAKLRKVWNTKSKKFSVQKFIMENHGWIDNGMHINSSEYKVEAVEKRISELLKIKQSTVKNARQELDSRD